MASKKPKTVLHRRKRQKKTDYRKRLRILVSGKPRLVVRFTNKKVIGQVIVFLPQGDKVLSAVDSNGLKKLGWSYSTKNFPAVYLTGLLLGKEALKKGNTEAVFDIGEKTPLHKSRIYAFLKGAVDSGMEIAHGSEEIFPDEERLSGKHIENFAKKTHDHLQFAEYLKNKAQPEKMSEAFAHVKKKIMGK